MIADQAAHVVGLLVDHAKELPQLGRVNRLRGVQHGGDGALDGGQRRPQLVAHQAEKLAAHALDLVERRQILHGHHDRFDGTVGSKDRGRVDERPDAAPVGDREHHLLGAHRLAGAELLRDGELAQGYLAAVGATAGQHLEDLLERMAGGAQLLDDAPRLAVERHRMAALRIEHHDADRGGLDEGLEIGPGAPLGAVGAGVGDRGRGLGGEQRQHLLVFAGELFPSALSARKKCPTSSSRWRSGVPRKVREKIQGASMPSSPTWPGKSGRRAGAGRFRRCSNRRGPPDQPRISRSWSGLRPEKVTS